MSIFLNDQQLNKEYHNFDKNELVTKIQKEIGSDMIIYKIFADKEDYSQKSFLNSDLEIKDIEELKFITRNLTLLIREILKKSQEFLPDLKNGFHDTANLFTAGDIHKANMKYKVCLEGLEWYSSIMVNLVTLFDSKEESRIINNILKKFKNVMNNLMKAYKRNDLSYAADIMDLEITEIIEGFMEINKDLLNKLCTSE